MKFKVTDKREQREGLIFKKQVYYCNIRVKLNDEEYEILTDLIKDKNWRDYPIGELELDSPKKIPVSIKLFHGLFHKSKHDWERSGRSESPEMRELKINNTKELASAAKEIIDVRLSALNQSDEDTVEEL